MSETLTELRRMSDAELMRLHDLHAERTAVGISHYLAELSRRDQERTNESMLRHTRAMTRMTAVITAATLVSTALVAATLLR